MDDFIAILKYRSTEEGGRKTPAKSGIWQLIKFSSEEGMFGGKQSFVGVDSISPGESVSANIKLLISDYFEKKLEEGMTFDFYDGPNLTGSGVIMKIINPILRKQ